MRSRCIFNDGNQMIRMLLVKVSNGTLLNPNGTRRSLNPSVAPPWDWNGSYGPYNWEERQPNDPIGGYEQVVINGSTCNYNPTSFEVVTFAFQERVANQPGYSAISEEPLETV